jgi:4-hydroxybenzoate polyprenyltransferase
MSWVFLFLIGAILTRGAGCTYNDMVDMNYDRQVVRTRTRPLVLGIATKKNAAVWIFIQLLLALGVLLCLPQRIFWPALSVMVIVALYPWVKRVSHFPQIVLGLAFNWGVILGAMAQERHLSFKAIFLYLAGVFWTLGYDTIYAHQDIEDDLKVGVKSTAIFFGDYSSLFIAGFYALFWLFLNLAGILSHVHIVFYCIVAPLIILTFYRLYQLNLNDPQACLVAFKQNQYIGIIVTMGFAIAKWIK